VANAEISSGVGCPPQKEMGAFAHSWPTLRSAAARPSSYQALGYARPNLGVAWQLPTAGLGVYFRGGSAGPLRVTARHSALPVTL